MARACDVCGKGTTFGRRISHAHNVSLRTFRANLQNVRAKTPGGSKRIRVCTRCLRGGLIEKATR